jgi:hypothetical protein
MAESKRRKLGKELATDSEVKMKGDYGNIRKTSINLQLNRDIEAINLENQPPADQIARDLPKI